MTNWKRLHSIFINQPNAIERPERQRMNRLTTSILNVKRTFPALALLSLLLLTACNRVGPLPAGYAIFIGNSEDVGLVLPPKGEILAGPKLATIGHSGPFIFGEVAVPRIPSPHRTGSRTPGYFILDSTTGAIELGLSREDWLKKLQKTGLPGEPVLLPAESMRPRR